MIRFFLILIAAFIVHAQAACGAAELKKVIFPDKSSIQAEVVTAGPERERGLMFRKALAPNAGMLFIFEREDQYSFWMKNMLFSIDIIWLDKDKKVVSIMESAPLCTDLCPAYRPNSNAQYVLELASGFSKAHGIKAGDQLQF